MYTHIRRNVYYTPWNPFLLKSYTHFIYFLVKIFSANIPTSSGLVNHPATILLLLFGWFFLELEFCLIIIIFWYTLHPSPAINIRIWISAVFDFIPFRGLRQDALWLIIIIHSFKCADFIVRQGSSNRKRILRVFSCETSYLQRRGTCAWQIRHLLNIWKRNVICIYYLIITLIINKLISIINVCINPTHQPAWRVQSHTVTGNLKFNQDYCFSDTYIWALEYK